MGEMKKGTLTKEMIVQKAAPIFNSRGYFGASMSDVMEATGLEKGGIYNHFASKDELALAAFDHIMTVNGTRVRNAVEAQELAADRLYAFLDAFGDLVTNPSVPGGCPLMNCAVDSDDAHPVLRRKVRAAMKRLLSYVEGMIQVGVDSGEFSTGIDPASAAVFIVASIEGGMMLSKLYEEPMRMRAVTKNLKVYVSNLNG
jgi:TetR/AcrR family transcriptional repressor of nem operon